MWNDSILDQKCGVSRWFSDLHEGEQFVGETERHFGFLTSHDDGTETIEID